MNVFSFRAECLDDLATLRLLAGNEFSFTCYGVPSYPDINVEVETIMTQQQISDLIRHVEDGHVMLQTLKMCALKDNSLERDYSRE
jgi:hypothetical protein